MKPFGSALNRYRFLSPSAKTAMPSLVTWLRTVLPMTSPHRLFALFLLTGAAALVSAKDFLPAIVYDFGGKFDRSFNQSASEGAKVLVSCW